MCDSYILHDCLILLLTIKKELARPERRWTGRTSAAEHRDDVQGSTSVAEGRDGRELPCGSGLELPTAWFVART